MNIQLSLNTSASSSVSQAKDNNTKADLSIKNMKDLREWETKSGHISIADEQLIKVVDRAVKSLQGPQTTLDISIHDKTHEIMVKVLNKETGEVIREVPPEKTLDLVAKMMELAGLFVDQRI